MALPIALYYDKGTRELSDNVVAALASRGIAFDYFPNNFEGSKGGRSLLFIDGACYDLTFIGEYQKEILDSAQKTDRLRRGKLECEKQSA